MLLQMINRLLLFSCLLISFTCESQSYATIGTGTASNAATSYPAPYGQWYWGAKHQFFVSAAELLSAGIPAGAEINEIGFDVVNINNAGVHTAFQIKVFSTNSSDPLASGYLTSGQVSSSSPQNYTPIAGGFNMHDISPFIWNGSSNLVIQTCFNNAAYTENASTSWNTNLSGTSIKSRYYRQDASGVCTSTSSTGSSANTRPHIRFGYSSSGYCTPAVSESCNEYISNVTLSSINNSSACTSGGYVDYTSNSTTLNKGSTYTVTITPSVFANCSGCLYTGDEIAVWIDYNGDLDFTDANEEVGYVIAAGSGTVNTSFTFTVPTNAITGNVRMRARISFNGPGGAPIDPCAFATQGETEDYTINIASAAPNPPSSPSSINSSTSNVCTGQNVLLTVAGGVGTTFWFNGSCGSSSSTSIGSGSSISVNPSSTTTYFARNYSAGLWSASCASKTINVSSLPVTPTAPTSNSPQCSSVTLTQNGSPPSGTSWYWQGTNANGTSTSNSNQNYYANSTGSYYLRARNASGCWSNNSEGLFVVVSGYPSAPANPSTNSPNCESVTLVQNGTPPSGTSWFWQGVNANGTLTNNSSSQYVAYSSGTYYIRARNSTGCWSNNSGSNTVLVYPTTQGTDNQISCDSYTWIDGNNYTQSTITPTIVLQNQFGCDSLVTLDLTIYNSTISFDEQIACGQYTWVDGVTYYDDNDSASLVLSTENGCDSTVTLNLTFVNEYNTIDYQLACESYTWIDGNTYYENNTSTSILLSSQYGCDSIVILNLGIGFPEDTTLFISSLGEYVMNGIIYTESGTYEQVLQNQYGCDSTVILNLNIDDSGVEGLAEYGISVYPNPFSSILHLDFEQLMPEQRLVLTDINGKVLLQRNALELHNVIHLEHLENGLYYLSIFYSDKSIGQVKVMKI